MFYIVGLCLVSIQRRLFNLQAIFSRVKDKTWMWISPKKFSTQFFSILDSRFDLIFIFACFNSIDDLPLLLTLLFGLIFEIFGIFKIAPKLNSTKKFKLLFSRAHLKIPKKIAKNQRTNGERSEPKHKTDQPKHSKQREPASKANRR